jgi:hypothetical protein
VSTTGQQVLERAVQRSSLNNALLLSATEALAWINAEQRFLFLQAARWNPEYFGKTGVTAVRASATASWDIAVTPGDVGAVTAIRVAAIVNTVAGIAVGTVCGYTTSRFPDLQVSPRIYLRGRKLIPYGTELGTGTDYVSQLELDYAELPSGPTALTQALRLPDEWTALPEIQLAKAMALRDQRREDIELLDAEYQRWFAAFQEHTLVLDHAAARPLQAVPALPFPTAK